MKSVWIIVPLAVGVGVTALFVIRGTVRFFPTPNTAPDSARAAGANEVAANPPPGAAARSDSAATPGAPLRFVASTATSAYDRAALDRLFEDALTNSNAEERRTVIRGVAEFLANHDVGKATEYTALLLKGTGRSGEGDTYAFTQQFSLTLAAKDPQATIAWAEILPDALKEVSYQLVARAWAASDPGSLANWVTSLGHPGHRATAIRTMGHVLGQTDPGGFGPRWAMGLAQSEDGPRFSDVVVTQWAKTEPEAAAAWAASLRESDDRDRGLLAWVSTVAERDPTLATAWSAKLPPGDLRNRTIMAAISKWAASDPAAAAAWVERDSSVPGLAESAFASIASGWMRKDPVAATRWIERAPVNPQTKAYILSLSEPRSNPSL